MKKQALIAVLSSLLSAAALGVSAQRVFADVNWAGAWSAWTPSGSGASCPPPWAGGYEGTAAVNGNDNGQVVAFCYANGAWTCGTQGGVWQFFARGRGHNVSTNQVEYTHGPYSGGTNGPSVGSTAGGFRIDETQCQMGYDTL